MAENPKKYLLDISESIGHIEQFTTATPGFFDYENNLLVRRAVERELGIIIRHLPKLKIEIELLLGAS